MARELEHQLSDSGATAIVVLENFAHTLQTALPRTSIKNIITTQTGDLFPWPKSLVTNLVVKHVKKMGSVAQASRRDCPPRRGSLHATNETRIALR